MSINSNLKLVFYHFLPDQIFAMLTKWSEDEGSGATNEEIVYILERAKMGSAVQNVFADKA